jgi:hypothetical protein
MMNELSLCEEIELKKGKPVKRQSKELLNSIFQLRISDFLVKIPPTRTIKLIDLINILYRMTYRIPTESSGFKQRAKE